MCLSSLGCLRDDQQWPSSENAVFWRFLKMMHAAIHFRLQKFVTDKVRCPHDKFCPVSNCHIILGARIKSGAFVKARRCYLNVIFRVIIRSIYMNTTENSLTHNSLHMTTKKTHSLYSKRQIILCLPRNYCLAIHETPLKSIFSCAKTALTENCRWKCGA